MYGEYDEFIAGTEIFDDINKSLDKIQKELSELITDDIDEEKKRLLTWEGCWKFRRIQNHFYNSKCFCGAIGKGNKRLF